MKNPVKNFNFLKWPHGDCTQWFGENPQLYSSIGLKSHNGLDIVRPWGDHLFAVEDGIICDLKTDPSGYGMHFRILSEYKKNKYREWTYGHMSHINVKLGDYVKAGQYVGNIGNTGFVVSNSTGNGFWSANPYAGTHLHLGLRYASKNPNGWQYPYDGSPKVSIDNYNNGNKGAVDPLPLFAPPKALAIARLADTTDNALLWKLAKVFYTINI